MPHEINAAIHHGRLSSSRKWPYQAKVMNRFEHAKSSVQTSAGWDENQETFMTLLEKLARPTRSRSKHCNGPRRSRALCALTSRPARHGTFLAPAAHPAPKRRLAGK